MKNYKALTLIAVLLVAALATTACSMNRVLPAEADEEAMVVEVRAAIAKAVPGTVAEGLKVDVTEGGVVTLEGNVDSQADIDSIVNAARAVNGVTRVNNRLRVKPD